MREINVWLKDKNYEQPVTYICPFGYEDLVDHRIFDNLQDVQYTLLALSRGKAAAYERGFACPADTRKAIEKIKNLPRY